VSAAGASDKEKNTVKHIVKQIANLTTLQREQLYAELQEAGLMPVASATFRRRRQVVVEIYQQRDRDTALPASVDERGSIDDLLG
jgi:hypothetical protein